MLSRTLAPAFCKCKRLQYNNPTPIFFKSMTIKANSGATGTAKKSTSRVTIDDIARAAGVSTATVSRALNKPETVSDKLREKIKTTVESIGYIPSGAARALALNRSFTVGAIVPTLKNAIFAATLAELEKNIIQLRLYNAGHSLKLRW